MFEMILRLMLFSTTRAGAREAFLRLDEIRPSVRRSLNAMAWAGFLATPSNTFFLARRAPGLLPKYLFGAAVNVLLLPVTWVIFRMQTQEMLLAVLSATLRDLNTVRAITHGEEREEP